MIVASIPVKDNSYTSILQKIQTDLVELRLDYLHSLDEFELDNLDKYRKKLILTVREQNEGGINYHDPLKKKLFLSKAMAGGFLVDLEDSFVRKYGIDTSKAIVSSHFLEAEPESSQLSELVSTYSNHSYVTKVALRFSPTSRMKLVRLLGEFNNLAVMELDGESSSRILYSMLGSRLLYCHLGEKTSPGQISCDEAIEIINRLRNRN